MSSPETNRWHFVTNHTQVLLCLQRNPDVQLRDDIAETVGITERAAQRIVTELVEGGYVTRKRVEGGTTTPSICSPRCVIPHSSTTRSETFSTFCALTTPPRPPDRESRLALCLGDERRATDVAPQLGRRPG